MALIGHSHVAATLSRYSLTCASGFKYNELPLEKARSRGINNQGSNIQDYIVVR